MIAYCNIINIEKLSVTKLSKIIKNHTNSSEVMEITKYDRVY